MEFSTPIRVRWDVDFRGNVGRAKRIARHIREIGPLFVELGIEGKRGLEAFPGIFTELHKGNPRVQARIRFSPGAASILRWGYPVDLVWEVHPPGPIHGKVPAEAARIAVCPDEEGLDLLPDIIEEFAGSGAAELHLINVNAVRGLAEAGHVPIPRADRIRRAAAAISRLPISLAGKKLVVHDYFLWRALKEKFPVETGDRVDFSGCQAASALAYVDWDGNVYPCDSLPIRLGNLLETPFDLIWTSPARASVLAGIRAMPAFCDSCETFDGCLAACRGLAYVTSGDFDSRDPGCSKDGGGGSP